MLDGANGSATWRFFNEVRPVGTMKACLQSSLNRSVTPSISTMNLGNPRGYQTQSSHAQIMPTFSRTFASALNSAPSRPPSLIPHGFTVPNGRSKPPRIALFLPPGQKRTASRVPSQNDPGQPHSAQPANGRTKPIHNSQSFNAKQPLTKATPSNNKLQKAKQSGKSSGSNRKPRRRSKSYSLNDSRSMSLPSTMTSSPNDSLEKRFGQAALVPVLDFLSPPRLGEADHSRDSFITSPTLPPISESTPQKIGKRREKPKAKRPSRLKRVILSERRSRRCRSAPSHFDIASVNAERPSVVTTAEASEGISKQVTQVGLIPFLIIAVHSVGNPKCQKISFI
ncbi:unnamed protein product [Echinostoma caproni]|uniref:Flocculation protein FLO11-like n=1 Tax=Echinostoma caproni TaxID=27848 RepID=A0A183B5Q7_9TREM|nr:unnamed protein product [Echinostoma caproni]